MKQIGLFIASICYSFICACLIALIISIPYLVWRQTDSFWMNIIMFFVVFGLVILSFPAASLMAIKFAAEGVKEYASKGLATIIIIIMLLIFAAIFGVNIFYLFSYRPYNATTFDCVVLTIAHAISFIIAFAGLVDD